MHLCATRHAAIVSYLQSFLSDATYYPHVPALDNELTVGWQACNAGRDEVTRVQLLIPATAIDKKRRLLGTGPPHLR